MPGFLAAELSRQEVRHVCQAENPFIQAVNEQVKERFALQPVGVDVALEAVAQDLDPLAVAGVELYPSPWGHQAVRLALRVE